MREVGNQSVGVTEGFVTEVNKLQNQERLKNTGRIIITYGGIAPSVIALAVLGIMKTCLGASVAATTAAISTVALAAIGLYAIPVILAGGIVLYIAIKRINRVRDQVINAPNTGNKLDNARVIETLSKCPGPNSRKLLIKRMDFDQLCGLNMHFGKDKFLSIIKDVDSVPIAEWQSVESICQEVKDEEKSFRGYLAHNEGTYQGIVMRHQQVLIKLRYLPHIPDHVYTSIQPLFQYLPQQP